MNLIKYISIVLLFASCSQKTEFPTTEISLGEKLFFETEGVRVYMQHIGGYPGRYAPGVREEIISHKANLFISGHSHILKVIYDDSLQCLHINPGAAGKQGWQKVRTLVRLVIDGNTMKDCEVIELGKQ